MVIDDILYCYDEDECVMGWTECNINKCPRYQDEIITNCVNCGQQLIKGDNFKDKICQDCLWEWEDEREKEVEEVE